MNWGGTERSNSLQRFRRRHILVGTGGVLTGLAGCLSSDDEGPVDSDQADTNEDTPTDDHTADELDLDIDDPSEAVTWTGELFGIIRRTGETPTETVRRMAMLTTAMYDAVTTLAAARGDPAYEPYLSYDDAPAAASPLAALGGAANELLGSMYPAAGAGLDETLAKTLSAAEADDGDIETGEQWGREVAQDILDDRANDGSDAAETYQACENPEETPGCWRGGSTRTWRSSHYAFLDHWVRAEPYEFEGPPPLDSQRYAESWQDVYELGDDRNRDGRPEEHVEIAKFWRGGAGTTRPSGRWLQIANKAIMSDQFDLTLLEATRLQALVALALGDAGVSSWHGKHKYGFWRPDPAIEHADTDGNPETFPDPDWKSIAVGTSPEYPSTLAAFGGAAYRVLVEVLGTDEFSFEFTSTGPPVMTRSFDSFNEALEESWKSRIYVGNHFRFSMVESVEAGKEIGERVLETELQPV